MRAAGALLTLGTLTWGCGGGDSGVGNVIPVTGSSTLADLQARVFTPRCALSGCHVGTTATFGLDLSSGQAVGNLVGVPSAEVPAFLRVDPFDATDSYVYMKLVNDPRILGDPMPLNTTPLSTADLALVETWINEGAR